MDLDAEAVRDVENNINTARWEVWVTLITTDVTRLTGKHLHSLKTVDLDATRPSDRYSRCWCRKQPCPVWKEDWILFSESQIS